MPIVFVDQPRRRLLEHLAGLRPEAPARPRADQRDDLQLYKITDNVDEAVREVRHFYSNYHSLRYNRDEILLRLVRKPTPEQLDYIRKNFADIKQSGDFTLGPPARRDAMSRR